MDFSQFEQWVLKDFGIDLSAYKSNQLHRRIRSLMYRIGVDNLQDYVVLLKKEESQRQRFLDFITINVTEFFRNADIFNQFKIKLQEELHINKRSLKIWSAACSTGAEPYSIAMILDEISKDITHNIIATDIDGTILEKAKKGEYISSDIRNISKEDIYKYFKVVGGKYILNDNIKSMVKFKKHDLILDRYDTRFDVIVCRNVIIYFNQDVKNDIYKKFSSSLNQGGMLFLGATESIYNYKNFGFEKASTFIYKKL